MPLLLLKRFCSYISKKIFYTLGVNTSLNPFTILFTCLFVICFISYPVLLNNTNTYSLPTTDGHFWQASPHLHSSNNTSSFIIQQIRVVSISEEALNTSLDIVKAVSISPQFKRICATTPQHQCISHSILPIWDYNQQNGVNIIDIINSHLHIKSPSTGISVYPYSTLGRVRVEHNKLVSADSFILTFILKNSYDALHIWNEILSQVHPDLLKLKSIPPCKFQFKLKLLPNLTKSTCIHTMIFLLMSCLLIVLFKNQFSRSKLIKSRTGLGVASIFLSLSCFTMTSRLFQWIKKDIDIHPWFLQLFICITTTVEHISLITAAVVEREKKEISIKERVGKGLEQTAIPMLISFMLKSLVLIVGSRTQDLNTRDFCLFGLVAIFFSFILSITVFAAILSIDIKRAELSDLNNDEFHIKKLDKKESVAYPHIDKNSHKKRNARRALNTLIVCIIVVYLNMFSPKTNKDTLYQPMFSDISQEWKTLSDQFWDIMNPFYDPQTFDVYAPSIVSTASIDVLESYYQHQFELLNQALIARTHQYTFLDLLHPYFIFTPHHISSVILFITLILMILWMIPTIRESVMLPAFRKVFVVLVTFFLRGLSRATFTKADALIRKVESDYNEDGVHVGALSLQSEFNRLQNLERVGYITIDTFSGQHVSDIRALDVFDGQLASIDQEGRLIVWNTETQFPVVQLSSGRARCVKMNANTITAGFDSGQVCVWDKETYRLVHEYKTSHSVTHLLLLADEILSVHRNGDVMVWKDETRLQCISTSAHIVHVHLDKTYFFAAFKDGQVVCWDTATWIKRYTVFSKRLVTTLTTERMCDSMGILVTGSDDGAVKVWDLDTGLGLCTVSKGGVVKKESAAEEVGGPLLQFSTVPRHDQPKTEQVDANHLDAITQVVAVRISNPNFENDACPGCHTTLSSGFFIASCDKDGSVHVWRLDRCGGYAGCVQCAKDYHVRKHYNTEDEWQPLFLGNLKGTRIVLFDSMVLGGIREEGLEWQVWFTSLQYYEPSSLVEEDWVIPSVTCSLDKDGSNEEEEDKEDDEKGILDYLLYWMFGIKKVTKTLVPKTKLNQTRKMDDDAYELLPFSNVRHSVLVDKTSFCCDYGNFLKIVHYKQKKKEK